MLRSDLYDVATPFFSRLDRSRSRFLFSFLYWSNIFFHDVHRGYWLSFLSSPHVCFVLLFFFALRLSFSFLFPPLCASFFGIDAFLLKRKIRHDEKVWNRWLQLPNSRSSTVHVRALWTLVRGRCNLKQTRLHSYRNQSMKKARTKQRHVHRRDRKNDEFLKCMLEA